MVEKIKRWLKKKWYKFFPIKRYERGNHYDLVDSLLYIITIQLKKGLYKDAIVGFEIFPSDHSLLAIKSVIIDSPDGIDFTLDEDWRIIAMQIFEQEFQSALDNYKTVKQDILNDDSDIGEDYFEEPVQKRTVRSKSSSVPKKRVSAKQKRKNSFPRNSGLSSKVQPPADHGSDSDIFGRER